MRYFSLILCILLASCQTGASSKGGQNNSMVKSTIDMTGFPPFSNISADDLPASMVQALVLGFAKEDQAQAKLQLESLIPKMTPGIGSHPKPVKYYEVVYNDLTNILSPQPLDKRPAELKKMVHKTEIDDISRQSFALAKAWILQNAPEKMALAREKHWVDALTEEYLAKEKETLLTEAKTLSERLEKWNAVSENEYPALKQEMNVEILEIRNHIALIGNKVPAAAIGSISDFLRDIGYKVNSLDVH